MTAAAAASRCTGGHFVTHVPHLTGTALLAEHGSRPSPPRPPASCGLMTAPTSASRSRAVEGPDVLRGVVDEAAARGVTVNRVSQGSGAMLQSEAELAEMARIGADNGIEVSLFVGPREEWDIGRARRGAGGRRVRGPAARDQAAAVRGRRHPAGGRAGHPRIPHRRPRTAPAGEPAAGSRPAAGLASSGRSRPSSPRRTRSRSGCSSGSAARPSTCRRT